MKEFHEQLVESRSGETSPFDASYSATRNYFFDREPPASYLARVAEVFDVDLVWLITGGGEEPAGRAESEAGAADAESQSPVQQIDRLLDSLLPEGTRHPRSVRGTFYGALERYAAGAKIHGPHSDMGHLPVLAQNLVGLLTLPVDEIWGFRRELTPRLWEDYSIAMLHALMLIMPRSGEGDPLSDLNMQGVHDLLAVTDEEED